MKNILLALGLFCGTGFVSGSQVFADNVSGTVIQVYLQPETFWAYAAVSLERANGTYTMVSVYRINSEANATRIILACVAFDDRPVRFWDVTLVITPSNTYYGFSTTSFLCVY